MGKENQDILESRERFDKSLDSPSLTNQESVRSLVQRQILRSTFSGSPGELEHIVLRRAREVCKFLELLRSASGHDKDSLKYNASSNGDWKLKQQTEQLRVMYKKGPEGTPFHTLLAEGYIDGPVDSCLCVSWESSLYKNWWPQYNFPTFKIIFSSSLQNIRVGEEISLVRVKPPWPVSEREAILHNFELEVFEEDIILVLLNTISTSEHFDMNTYGVNKDFIPETKDMVRIDVTGGFALQKVSPNRSYFRAIMNMDIKLDIVHPSLINFISRQLLANGHTLYQKAVVAVAAGDEEYREALNGPMYARIRDYLYSSCNPKSVEECFREGNFTDEEHVNKEIIHDFVQVSTIGESSVIDTKEKQECKKPFSVQNQLISSSISLHNVNDHQRKGEEAYVSPEVKHALNILDKAISLVSERCSDVSRPGAELHASDSVSQLMNEDLPAKAEDSGMVSKSEGCQVIKYPRVNGTPVDSAVLSKVDREEEESLNPVDQSLTTIENSVGDETPTLSDLMSKVFDEDSINAGGTQQGTYTHQRKYPSKHRKKMLHKKGCFRFLRL